MVSDYNADLLADHATRETDVYACDLIAWAVADSREGDRAELLRLLDDVNGPSIYERMTGDRV